MAVLGDVSVPAANDVGDGRGHHGEEGDAIVVRVNIRDEGCFLVGA